VSLTLYDEFAGCGGSSQGAAAVPGVELVLAANHTEIAIRSHAANFPAADHYLGDVRAIDMAKFPRADLFWASPSCPPFSSARGKRRDFDRDTQGMLFETDQDAKVRAGATRGRALMHEIPRYLEAMRLRGRPVLGGVVENVVEARLWDMWPAWLARIRGLGYQVRVIAINSMHAAPRRTQAAPQSRDRLFAAYWLASLGRVPDWGKWLRPQAWCPVCDERVTAVQVFKVPGRDMGRYGRYGQYWYRCPHRSCRNAIAEPQVLPAAVAIDWSLEGTRIGDRVDAKGRPDPLAPATIARIKAGIGRYWAPVLAPAGGTWRDKASTVDAPMPARTAVENDGLAVPPFVTVHRGEDSRTSGIAEPLPTMVATANQFGLAAPPFITVFRGKSMAQPVGEPLGTVTAAGAHHGLFVPPFLTPLRSGRPRTIRADTEPLATVVAGGGNHGLAIPPLVMRNNTPRGGPGQMYTPVNEPLRTITTAGHQSLLVPYYGNGTARRASEPIGTLTARDRYALATGRALIDVDDVRFRMLEPHEIAAAMAFGPSYVVLGSKRQRVRQLGNAVTPPVAEVIVSALVEAITGEDLERCPAS
jgi:DNA (cytosine-5)-methyltransferase 1